ncbi:hypothetical protein FDP41_004853 [Naegleria fowleri]|uniref:Uncharacterized protein n=1 Tax=Naegleria fowleri TaxID=5763 RepID=A0A6A5BPP7_NAEFO|nr:uncharacterized protein FDP41_004853 [Naegleria fowleri]KAF0976178.1 hypothetical protein FDP41_004853 [Naegleria fowleri]CAG4717995.1 unnamed protein product [Naegleria fowleri]
MALTSNTSVKRDLTEELRGEFYSSTYRKVFVPAKIPLYYRKRVCNILFSIQEGSGFKKKTSRFDVSFNGGMNQNYPVTENKQMSSRNLEDAQWIPKFGQKLIRFQNILNLEHGAQVKILFFTPNEQTNSGEVQLGRVLIDLFDKNVFNENTSKTNGDTMETRATYDVLDYENKVVGRVSVYIQAENLIQKK